MNVLVLSGPGVAPGALRQTLASLRALLVPYYSVQTVSPDVLASDTWIRSCALLVFTGGRDLLYVSSLAGSNHNIRNYVHQGGSFLGFCAGAFYASASIEWELGRDSFEVKGSRPLKFYPGLSRGCVYPGFEYGSDNGARVVPVTSSSGRVYNGLYYNGGGEFIDAQVYPKVSITANYESTPKVAAVSCNVGLGKAKLWGVHVEYSLILEPLRDLLQDIPQSIITQWEADRRSLLQDELQSLGLKIPERSGNVYLRPLPQYLLAAPHLKGLVGNTMSRIASGGFDTSPWILKDIHDTFHFHETSPGLRQSLEPPVPFDEEVIEPELDGVKHVIVCKDGLPEPSETPLFNVSLFFSSLQEARSRQHISASTVDHWGAGDLLFYGEAVTSTHTLLDQNPALMNKLPVPLLSLATHQLSGRGRGGNVWLSPPGQLMFSLLLRASYSNPNGPLPYLPTARLVYIQYLVGIAIVKSCRDLLGEDGKKVRLKWPNDIYAVYEDNGATVKKKLGGILVGSTFHDGNVSLLIGCGLNVFNSMPTTSLSAISPSSATTLKVETLAADIVSRIEIMWKQFLAVRGSFDSFTEDYLEFWLHSDEVVTLATTQPHTKVRIVGLAPQHGLLRTIPLNQSWVAHPDYIDLQPDGNTFDMLVGLIKSKT